MKKKIPSKLNPSYTPGPKVPVPEQLPGMPGYSPGPKVPVEDVDASEFEYDPKEPPPAEGLQVEISSATIQQAFENTTIIGLVNALKQSVRVTREWHGHDVFDIYYHHAPEMRQVKEMLDRFGITYDDIFKEG